MAALVLLLSWVFSPAGTQAAPPDYAAVYAKGVTFAAFLEHATTRADEWRQHYNDAAVTPDLVAAMRALPERRRMLVVSEASCGDSVNSLPYLARLVDGAPERLELRVVSAAVGRAVQEAHTTADGRAATPTVVVLAEDGRLVGAWTERPAPLREQVDEWKKTERDSQVKSRIRQWYLEDGGKAAVAEIVAILSK